MADPLTADRLVRALRAEGCRVVEYRSWRSHNRNHKGAWGPVHGVMIHHTVTSGTMPTVRLCYDGHSTLPGPLCHTVGAKDGRLFMVGNGRANHAGRGDGDVLADVIGERPLSGDNEADTDGNARFYGLELENLGDGRDPWPEVQVDAAARWAAGICRAHGWNERSVIGHKEWQPGKIDPTFDMDSFRSRVRRLLASPAGREEENDMALSKDDVRAIWQTDGVISSPDPEDSNTHWRPSVYLASTYRRARRIEAMVSAQGETIRELARALGERDAAVDVEGLVARIEERLEAVTVRLDVPEQG